MLRFGLGSILEVGQNDCQRLLEIRYVALDHDPDSVQIDAKVVVYQEVAYR